MTTEHEKNIIICTPCYDGGVQYQYMLSCIKLMDLCKLHNINVGYLFTARESLIPRARNSLTKRFLDCAHATHLLFLDADIQFEPEDIIRMIEADVDVIGGVYPKKTITWRADHTGPIMDYVVEHFHHSRTVADIMKPHPVKHVGTGMMLIKRTVLERMMEAFPNDWYYIETTKHFRFFDTEIVNESYLSEDYYFCDRWQRLGGTVYAAHWTRTTHWGLHGFEGDIIKTAAQLSTGPARETASSSHP